MTSEPSSTCSWTCFSFSSRRLSCCSRTVLAMSRAPFAVTPSPVNPTPMHGPQSHPLASGEVAALPDELIDHAGHVLARHRTNPQLPAAAVGVLAETCLDPRVLEP